MDTSGSSKRQPRSLPNLREPELWHQNTTIRFKPMPICLKCFHKSATNPCSLTPGREASHRLMAETWWSIPAGLYVYLDSNVSLIPFSEQSSILRTSPLCQRGFLRTKTLCCPGHSSRGLNDPSMRPRANSSNVCRLRDDPARCHQWVQRDRTFNISLRNL